MQRKARNVFFNKSVIKQLYANFMDSMSLFYVFQSIEPSVNQNNNSERNIEKTNHKGIYAMTGSNIISHPLTKF